MMVIGERACAAVVAGRCLKGSRQLRLRNHGRKAMLLRQFPKVLPARIRARTSATRWRWPSRSVTAHVTELAAAFTPPPPAKDGAVYFPAVIELIRGNLGPAPLRPTARVYVRPHRPGLGRHHQRIALRGWARSASC
jgi:hypothetical protein